jgi:multiple sugar transport system substrate-binding protein
VVITLLNQRSAPTAGATMPNITLRMEGWVASKANQSELDSLLAQFEKTHKHIKVAFSPVEGDFESQLEAQFLSHSAPDVFEIDAGWARDFMQAGALARLDHYAYGDKSYHPSDFAYKLVNEFSYRGRTYAYPFGYTTLGLWYAKSPFKALHIKHPPTDWRSFARVACELTDKKKHVFGAVLSPAPSRWFAFLRLFGGRVLNAKGNRPAIASKQSVKALQWYAGLIRKGCAEEPPAGSTDAEEFGNGHAAMMFETSDIGTMLKADYAHLAWGVSRLPTGPKGNANLAFLDGFAMSARSKQKAAAWKLISYLTGKTTMNDLDAQAGYLPARNSVHAARSLSAFARGAAYATPWAWPPGLVVNAFPQISADVDQAATRQVSYKSAVADMAVWLKRYL